MQAIFISLAVPVGTKNAPPTKNAPRQQLFFFFNFFVININFSLLTQPFFKLNSAINRKLKMEESDDLLSRDLSNCILTIEMKKRLVEEVFKAGSSFRIVANKVNLRRDRVISFRKKLLKGRSLFESVGRPAKLDKTSVSKILNAMRMSPVTSEADLYPLIRDETVQTFIRRYPNAEVTRKAVRIPKPSVVRWAKKLFGMFLDESLQEFL